MSAEEKETYEHDIYKYCKDEKDADAVAWAFVNPKKMVKFPFKFPELKPNEIRANILYAGLCHSDVLTVRSEWGPAKYPIAPGHEMVGEVSLVGSEVKDFKKGDLVGFGTRRNCCEKCDYCLQGRENLCTDVKDRGTYGHYWGGYSTAIQHPAKFFYHLPENFKLNLGSPLFCAGITTYYPMKKFLKEGMKTAVIGIGGLGHVAIQFLHKLGHKVAAFTTSKDKEELIKKLGGDEIIISTDEEEMKKAKGKFDFVMNTLPVSESFDKYLCTVAKGGYFVQVGLAPASAFNVTFDYSKLVINELTIVGSCVGPREPIREMIKLCVEKDIYPMVEEFSFEDFPKAFDRLENGKPKFRCVVNVKDWAEKNGFRK